MKRLKLKITGEVQGVFFRHNAKRVAGDLGIYGWISNCPDGSVEAEIEGEEKKVREFLNWCHQGAPMATVENVEAEEREYKGEFKDFEVR